MEQVAAWALVVLVFAGPTSRALFNVSALVLLASWLLSGRLVEHWAVARSNPIAMPALLLFGVILVGMTYSEAEWRDKWEHFRVYSKLPFLLLLVALLQERKWQERCWVAFVAAMAVVVGATYLNVALGLPWSWASHSQGTVGDRSVFLDYVIQGWSPASSWRWRWSGCVIRCCRLGGGQLGWPRRWWWGTACSLC